MKLFLEISGICFWFELIWFPISSHKQEPSSTLSGVNLCGSYWPIHHFPFLPILLETESNTFLISLSQNDAFGSSYIESNKLCFCGLICCTGISWHKPLNEKWPSDKLSSQLASEALFSLLNNIKSLETTDVTP